jgi:hypothetical protein
MSTELPERLDRSRHVGREGRSRALIIRRVVLGVLSAIVVLALLNVFGQTSTTSRAEAPRADLEVRVPAHLRGGLLYQGRIVIEARDTIDKPVIELGPGWIEEIQANTVAPSPDSEVSRDGRWTLEYARLAAGDKLTVWMQFGVNPTGAGRRDQSVRLLDGDEQIAEVQRRVTVYP